MNSTEFRKHAHQMVDWVADYLENTEKYPVKSKVKAGEIINQLPLHPPTEGESMDTIFEDFQKIIVPGVSHWQHPSWFAYFPANNSPASILGEILTAGLGVQGMIWDTSPAATELEEQMMVWLRKMIGLPDDFIGVIQDTASTATLCALLSAREKTTGFEINHSGFQNQKLRVYASSQTHSSIEKGVKIAGLGKENLVYIEHKEDFSINTKALEQAIIRDKEKGFSPCCIIANLGTTSSMAMDDVDTLSQIATKHKVWLHIDAAFAGSAAIVPEFRSFMKGAGQADSFVFNPHKWMLTNFDCSAYFVKNKEILIKTFSIMPEYLKTEADQSVNNYRDWGIQLGRRFRALKLWFVIRNYGINGIQEMIRRHVALAKEATMRINQHPKLELTAPQNLSLVCFRYHNASNTQDELNAINAKLVQRLNETGKVYLTHTILNNIYTIRLSVGQRNTNMTHIDAFWKLLQLELNDLN